jgi:hypothetical protein
MKKSAYLNDPNRIPTIYSRVERITLSDTPEGLNTLHTDDGGVIHFYLAPGERILSVQEKQAKAVAVRYASANFKAALGALKSSSAAKKVLTEAIYAYAASSEVSAFDYEGFVESLRDDRKLEGLLVDMLEKARALQDVAEDLNLNDDRLHDEIVELFSTLVPESLASRIFYDRPDYDWP